MLRSQNTKQVNATAHLGKEKVALLEEELRKQDSYFKRQEAGLIDENRDLRQEIENSRGRANDKNETMDQMVAMAVEIK